MRTTLTPFAPDNQRAADTCPLSLKWCFQLLLELGGHRNLLGRHGFNDDDLALGMGLGKWVEADDYSAADALKGLRQGARKLQADHPQVSYPDRLRNNLEELGTLLKLSEAELRILGFCVLMHSDPVLSDATDQLGTLGLKRAMKVLSVLLGLTPAQIEAGVGPESSLIRAGLLAIGTGHRVSLALSSLLYTSNANLPGLLRYSQGTPLEMFSYAFRLSPPGSLSGEHYSHVKGPLDIAQRYLSKALRQGKAGVNILLYGPPGTGKTQLTRLLAHNLESALYEVACTDQEGDPVFANQRLCSLRAANTCPATRCNSERQRKFSFWRG